MSFLLTNDKIFFTRLWLSFTWILVRPVTLFPTVSSWRN